jgi:DNA polymerase
MNSNLDWEMQKLEVKWKKCLRCTIGSYAFSHVVGEGSVPAKYLFVGEGPGVSEDVLGIPFIGKSGKLLREALKTSGFLPNEFYITNLVACRPCDQKSGPNRAPTDVEILNCSERLEELAKLVKPKLIVAVGSVAGDWLSEILSNYRMIKIKHPAYILRSGGEKGELYKNWLASIKFLRKLIKEK